MNEHTKGLLRVGHSGAVVADHPVPEMSGSDAVEYYGGHLVAESVTAANARRLAACWNSCDGFTTEELEAHTGPRLLRARLEGAFARIDELLSERNRVGIDISSAILSGIVPDRHPLRSRLELLANHHKHEQALADGMVALADQCHLLASLLRELRDGVEGDWCLPGDLDERIDSALAVTLCVRLDAACTEATTTPTEQDYRELQEQHDQLQSTHKGTLVLLQEAHEVMRRVIPSLPQDCAKRGDLLDRIEVALAGQLPDPAVTVTETIRTAPERIWLQVGDQRHYHSEPFPSDTSEVSWCSDSVVGCEVPYVRADLAGHVVSQPLGLLIQMTDILKMCRSALITAHEDVQDGTGKGVIQYRIKLATKAINMAEHAIDAAAKANSGRLITEGQELELITVLQSIVNGFSDDPAHDAAALLKRITGEVPWAGDSFQLPPHQGGEQCNSASPSSSPA